MAPNSMSKNRCFDATLDRRSSTGGAVSSQIAHKHRLMATKNALRKMGRLMRDA
jgi:hypothetical protein